MKHSLLLLLIMLCPALLPGAAHAEPFAAGRTFDQRMVADVMSVALTFIAPRTLEAVPIPDLTMWALRGLTTLDARLQPELKAGTLRLLAPGRVLLARAPPADDDAHGWAVAAGQMARAGWDSSESVRHAGTGGIIRTLFDEMFNHLDPYSRYAPPEEAREARNRRAGQGGVGVQVGQSGGGFVVQSIVEDGPAWQAGLRPGGRLLAVDGESVQGADLAAVTALIAGPVGAPVSLTVRERDGKARTVELARALVPPQTVASERAADLLVLHVSSFSSDTGARLAQALVAGTAGPHPPRGVVLDLRGNRGGLLLQAVAAAEVLLPQGVVAATAGRDPAAAHLFVANGQDLSGGLPIVVLVDGRSASAAEILAAALADQHRAVVAGSATLGKGLVQTITPLPDGGELLVTWSRVLAPLGWPVQGLGVLPQVCTSLGEEQLRRQLAGLARGDQAMARALARARTARPPIPPAETLEIRNACPAAEGRDLDLLAANRLIHDPNAYSAALLGPPASPTALPPPAPRDLTAAPALRN